MSRLVSLLSRSKKSRRALQLERLEDRSLLTAGMLDPTFGDGGQLLTNLVGSSPSYDIASSAAVQADGKIVVAGYTNLGSPGGNINLALVRYDAAGSRETSFGDGGTVLFDIGFNQVPAGSSNTLDSYGPTKIVVQPDGTIVVAYSQFGATGWDFAVARVNANGSLDTTFNGTGKQSVDFGSFDIAKDIVVQADGKIVVAGSTSRMFTGEDFAVARLNTDGSLDSGFGTGGQTVIDFGAPLGGIDDVATALALQTDGMLVVAGYTRGGDFGLGGGFELARLQTDGNLDSTFGSGGLLAAQVSSEPDAFFARGLAIQPDGRIVVAGQHDTTLDYIIQRFEPDGSMAADSRAFISGSTMSFSPKMALQSTGQILLAGVFPVPEANSSFGVMRLNSDLTLDGTFGVNGIKTVRFNSSDSLPYDLVVQSDDRIMVIGSSNQTGTSGDFALARLTGDGIFDAPFADADGDGIEDSVDTQPLVFSDAFTDIANGGVTTGTITDRGNQVLFVQDASAPDGFLITAHPLGGVSPATVSIENGAASLSLSAGDQIIATHGSVKLNVITGTVEATFKADSGETVASATLAAGAELTFKPDIVSFIAAASSAQPVAVQFVGTTGQQATAVLSAGSEVNFEPATLSISAAATNPEPVPVTLSDGSVLDVTPGQTVSVGNSPPTLTDISAQQCTETELTAHVAASDPDADDTLTYSVSFLSKNGPGAVNDPTSFSIDSSGFFHWTPGGGQLGQYTFNVTVTDSHGATAEQQFVITTLGLLDDGTLVIVGSSGDDKIDIKPTDGNPDDLTVKVNEKDFHYKLKPQNNPDNPYTGVTLIHICGLGGDDLINIHNTVAISAWLEGGAGNDELRGGEGDDVILGGSGDDQIFGDDGNDMLIGGLGADKIKGEKGNDILVSGDVAGDLDFATLHAISQDWAATHTVTDDTVDDFLDETVGDANCDQLTGGAGADLFIISTGDTITDFKFGKPNKNKDGDVVIKDGVVVT